MLFCFFKKYQFANKVFAIIIVIVLISGCYEEVEIHSFKADPYLKFDNVYAGIDMDRDWILLPVKDKFSKELSWIIETNVEDLFIDGKVYSDGDILNIQVLSINDSLGVAFQTEGGAYFNGCLYFTTLPVIQLFCKINIPDEPKVLCDFILTDNSGDRVYSLVSKAGIEIRGRSAMTREKKSFGIELWNNNSGTNKRKESLIGMRNDDDWILDAMYIDKARMRNKVSMDIWGDICKDREWGQLHQKFYTESRFVELFLNLEYMGAYCLSERFDRKQLDLKRYNGSPQGLLYKSESWSNTIKFISLADTSVSEYWDGWEQKYPKPSEFIYWRPLYNFTDFVIYATDPVFKENIGEYLNIDNLIDYFLFINVCTAFDNMGMNMVYSRYDRNSRFIITPWDLDASWGRNWDSTLLCAEHWLSNRFYNRLFDLNAEASLELLQSRWSELRSTVLDHTQIMEPFCRCSDILKESGACKREKLCWPEMKLDMESELDYIRYWSESRLLFMDNKIRDAGSMDWDK